MQIQDIEKLLAQTQCTECGFDGCAPYAEALVNGDADINLCRPGGDRVMKALAKALGKPEIAPAKLPKVQLAIIDASQCIGCTLCIQACPTDAIVGAPKQLHGIIASDCTGCGLCVPKCPEKCIVMDEAQGIPDSKQRAEDVRLLVQEKRVRIEHRFQKNHDNESTLSGQIKDIDYQSAGEVGVTLSTEMQAKMDAARAAAKKKWTEKKTPSLPKVLR